MNWAKAAIFAAVILAAIVAAIYWRKFAGAVVVPVTLLALYAVCRWRRDD